MNRKEILSHLKQNPQVSVLIVGAGINGIGTFRDLAMNGVDVLLIDRADFCSGASSASSHMAHGGIRYLENGEFRLVREAVGERNRLLQNAAHIVKPLPTTIPIFKYFSGILNAPLKFFGWLDKPSERGSLIIKLGLMMYDAYTGKQKTVPKHKFLSRHTSLKKWNQLNSDIKNTAVYYDGLITNPERLALDLILDSEAENSSARAVNYMSLVSGEKDKVILRDELTDERYEIQPKLLINASGAWIDFSNHSLGLSTKFIGGTKGSHLVLNHPELRSAIGDNEFFFENKDGRIVLICPLFDRVLVGTSDIKIENPDEAFCTDEEVDYFLELIKHVFPSIQVTHDHIVFRYSGVRPLENSTAKSTSQYSRDHSIQVLSGDWTNLQFPVYSLVGGKWTTFRAFSEQVTDKSLEFLGIKRQKDTKSMQIGGGHGYPTNQEEKTKFINGLAAWTGLSKERLEILFERYGTRAEAFADFIKNAPDEPLKFLQNYSKREIIYIIQHEKVQHLDDLILRRSMLAMLGKLSTQGLLELVEILGETLSWNDTQKNDEAERTLRLLENKHQVRL
ncbi:MAG: glycerol-3-phosphate dehydrogenase/oxidase [Anaerolineales bacterium]|nr:glycerol-3-phosphate dehydrogenase/oxidase [Anaerolineales bacterium]